MRKTVQTRRIRSAKKSQELLLLKGWRVKPSQMEGDISAETKGREGVSHVAA